MSQFPLPVSVVRDANMPSRVTVNGARLAFVKLDRPVVPANNPTGEPKFGVVVLIPATAQQEIQALYGVQWEVCQKEMGQQAANIWQQMQAQDKLAIHDGRTKAGQAGFDGAFFINASAKAERPPKLFHKYLDSQTGQVQVLNVPQSVIYSGCYANVQLNFWQQNNEHGKRVNAEVLAVQFAEDGEAFAAGAEADISAFSGVQAPTAPGFGAPPQGTYPGAAPQQGMPPGAPQGAYGGAPQPGAYPGAAQPPQGAYPGAAPQQGYGMPPGAPQPNPYPGAAAQPTPYPGAVQGMAPQQGYGASQQGMPPGAPQQGYGAAPGQGMAPQQGYGMPPGAPQQGMAPGYGAPQHGMPSGAGGFPGAPVPGAPGGYPGI